MTDFLTAFNKNTAAAESPCNQPTLWDCPGAQVQKVSVGCYASRHGGPLKGLKRSAINLVRMLITNRGLATTKGA